MMTARRSVVLAGLVAGLAGCAIASKSAPLDVRYFDPDRGASAPAARAGPAQAARLKLGRFTAAAHLRHRIVRRTSAVELHAYDSLRWTDVPATYTRRALDRALFAAGDLDRAVGGPVPILDVEVIAFEHVTAGAGGAGRVELRYELRDERVVLAAGVVRAERPASGPGIEGVVVAIGAALDAAAIEIADRVTARLAPER